MEQLIEIFKTEVREAIATYTDTKKRNISGSRKRDIAEIEVILNEQNLDLNNRIQAITQKLKSLKTGWWIFSTKKSTLRENIFNVISRYQDVNIQLLLAREKENRAQSSTLTSIFRFLKKVEIKDQDFLLRTPNIFDAIENRLDFLKNQMGEDKPRKLQNAAAKKSHLGNNKESIFYAAQKNNTKPVQFYIYRFN